MILSTGKGEAEEAKLLSLKRRHDYIHTFTGPDESCFKGGFHEEGTGQI